MLLSDGVMRSALDDRTFGLWGLGPSPLFVDIRQASSLPARCSEVLLAALGSIGIFFPLPDASLTMERGWRVSFPCWRSSCQ